jgi:hypothetical protein
MIVKSVTDSGLSKTSFISELLANLQFIGSYFGYNKSLRRLSDLYKLRDDVPRSEVLEQFDGSLSWNSPETKEKLYINLRYIRFNTVLSFKTAYLVLITHRSTQNNSRLFCFFINFIDNKETYDVLNIFNTTNDIHRLGSDVS